jgi:hypothetical protein
MIATCSGPIPHRAAAQRMRAHMAPPTLVAAAGRAVSARAGPAIAGRRATLVGA